MKPVRFRLNALRLAILAVAAAAFLPGCVIVSLRGRCWKTSREERAVPAEGVGSVRAETHNGPVRVTGDLSAAEIRYVAVRKAAGRGAESAERALAAIEIVERREGDALVLGWRWREGPRWDWREETGFEIVLPARLAASVETHNGPVFAEGVEGGLRAASHNGPVEALNCAGPGHLKTHNGPVKAAGHRGPLEASTHNGPIHAEASGETRLRSHNGPVRAGLTSDGPVRASIETHNGPVSLSIAEGASARIEARSEHGPVAIDERFEPRTGGGSGKAGRCGGGEGLIEVASVNGPVRIR